MLKVFSSVKHKTVLHKTVLHDKGSSAVRCMNRTRFSIMNSLPFTLL